MSICNNGIITLSDGCNYRDLFINTGANVNIAGTGRKCYINTD